MSERSRRRRVIGRYHQQSKHGVNGFARSLGYLDWANQPNPFRFYEGCQQLKLPLPGQVTTAKTDLLFAPPCGPGQPLDLDSVGHLLRYSLALSAWKQSGDSRWSLRINPSSGNLHPEEAYLLCGDLPGLPAGLYHYSPFLHCLEKRGQLANGHGLQGGLLLGLSTIAWREAWKYGERSFRYCQLDTGHALAALALAASLLGWRLRLLTGLDAEQLATLLGLARQDCHPAEGEEAELLCWLSPDEECLARTPDLATLCQHMATMPLVGQANQLSRNHQPWPVLEEVARASQADGPELPAQAENQAEELAVPSSNRRRSWSLAEVIVKRRSGVSFLAEQSQMAREVFEDCLTASLFRPGLPPFAGCQLSAQVHLLLFVHRVEGLKQGLYLLLRNENHFRRLQVELATSFAWQRQGDLPLYLLAPGDFRSMAQRLSCDQDIAADSSFAVAMLARFQENIDRHAHAYRQLFWEAGMIGQLLYLQAEAHDYQGTGIGCFFDDELHALCGLQGEQWQDLYHFTVGRARQDERLITLPAYSHLR